MSAAVYPSGTTGIILSATEENYQEDLFFPADRRLVAVNVNGDYEMGSLVYDLNKANEYDAERWARLQSAFRVLKNPLGYCNALGIQMGVTGQGDADCGWLVDDNPLQPGRIVAGRMSQAVGGPFDCGDGKCKHVQGVDADDNPISSLHITTRALFRKNNDEDGPIRFEDVYEEGKDGVYTHPCHLSWTGADWAIWVKTWMGPPPGWKDIGPGVIKDPLTPQPATIWPIEYPTPVVPNIDYSIRPSPNFPATIGPIIHPTKTVAANVGSLSVMQEVIGPGIVGQAQTSVSGKFDIVHSAISLSSGSATTFKEAEKEQKKNPATGQMAAFGAQGGERESYSAGTVGHGASGDPWIYTQRPGPHSKYPMGTSDGGFVFLPPEVTMADWGTGFAPPGVTLSTTYVLTGPGVWFGAGIPELTNGSLQDGYSWGMDTATGDLLFRRHRGGDDPDTQFKLDLSGGNYSWKSNTSFWGTLEHANTADRTYTFANVSGTVLLTATASGTFTAGSVLFADSSGLPTEDNALLFFDDSLNRLGIGVNSSLGARLHIIDTTAPQFRIGYDASNYVGFETASDGGFIIRPTGSEGRFSISTAGTSSTFTVENSDNTNGASHARLRALVGGTSGGDPHFLFTVSSVEFAIGLDNSDGDTLKINAGASPSDGTTIMELRSTGAVGINVNNPTPRLHVRESEVSGTTYNSDDVVTIEKNGSCAINVIGSTTGTSGIFFSDTTRARAFIRYSHVTDALTFRTAGADQATLSSAGVFAVNQILRAGTATDAGSQGDFSTGLTGAGRFFYDQSEQAFNLYETGGTLSTRISDKTAVETVFNDTQLDIDHRIEGDSLSHLFFTDATATTENIAVFAAAAPNWQSLDRGFFAGESTAAPSGNPSAGYFLYGADWNGAGTCVPFVRGEDGGIVKLCQQAGIADADGTLADITTKFNSLIAKLETNGLLATV